MLSYRVLIVNLIQGVYVLLDSRFKLLTQISNTKQYMELAPKVCILVLIL